MDDIEYVIRTILDPNTNLQINNTDTYTGVHAYAIDLYLYLFPGGVGIKIPNYKITPRDLVNALNGYNTLPGIERYSVYFDKDEHFNHEVNGEKVLPFELNDLAHQVFELVNKLTSDLEKT